jgi:hypothetical protein
MAGAWETRDLGAAAADGATDGAAVGAVNLGGDVVVGLAVATVGVVLISEDEG